MYHVFSATLTLIFVVKIQKFYDKRLFLSCSEIGTNLLVIRKKDDANDVGVESNLNCIDDWLRDNKLALNVDKTHCMPFKRQNTNQAISLGAQMIQVSKTVRYLGITVDRNLNFKEHIKYLLRKRGKHLGNISKIKHFVSKYVLLK